MDKKLARRLTSVQVVLKLLNSVSLSKTQKRPWENLIETYDKGSAAVGRSAAEPQPVICMT